MAKKLYVPRKDWSKVVPGTGRRVYFRHPVFGLRWRQDNGYSPILTACSGIALNSGGIDHLSYGLKDGIYKVDWRRIMGQKDGEFVILEHVPAHEHRDFHYLSLQGVRERYFDLPIEMNVLLGRCLGET